LQHKAVGSNQQQGITFGEELERLDPGIKLLFRSRRGKRAKNDPFLTSEEVKGATQTSSIPIIITKQSHAKEENNSGLTESAHKG
jgi:hypothetical protein